MKRRAPIIIRLLPRGAQLQAATNRAIDAVLGKKVAAAVKAPWPGAGEVEREFRDAQRRPA